ncbi:acyl-CoA dehydrogenase [Actinomadura xylanilytica]|uniref:acyl-CoA dehydrogenase n=1 Tax=Actinomadura xylanilytica TaxID=887459 RepID=UPI00255B056C|nr:acyl-CoA dehydrogenase [Actinomadura xylanilytica]MDL4776907.1 acyl-CoA dehydrogenase [Actinomadura xylanilytica]
MGTVMGTGTTPDPALLRLVRGDSLDAKTRARLDEAVPPEFFGYPAGLTAREHQALTYARLRRAGLAAPPAPELLADPPALCALLERAAIADPALFHVMLLHYTLALGPILRFGAGQRGPAQARDDLETMASFGTLLMTEVGRSNSHLSPRTLARHDPGTGGFVLSTPDAEAAKFPTNSAHPQIPKTAAVYATLVHGGLERGVFVFVAPLRGPDGQVPEGVRIVPAPETGGLQVDYAAVHLDGLRLPHEAWLRDGAGIGDDGAFHDPAGDPAARLTRSMGIAPAVWRAVIAASAAITRASAAALLAHSTGRPTLGRLAPRRPLTDYRNQQEAILGALASAYALTAVAGHVKARRTSADAPTAPDGPAPPPGAGPSTAWAPWSAVDRDLALLKTAATLQAQETVSLCRVHSGAPGFAANDRLNGYRGLAHAYTNAGGDNELILFDTARAMADLDRYTPPHTADQPPGDGDLTSPPMWLHLAGGCERRLRRRLADRVAAGRRGGQDAFTAWNDNLALATRTATAHADRIVLEILAAAHTAHKGVLRQVLTLYALGWMERRAGILLNEGIIAPGTLDRVWELRRRVCDELAPHAAGLAAAFELPPEITAPARWVTET